MATAAADAAIIAQARLRHVVTGAVLRNWRLLGSWRDADVERFLARTLPIVAVGQRQAAAITDAYLARAMERRPIGIDPALVVGAAVRNGTPPADVYRRPFETLWSGLGEGKAFPDAFGAATARLSSTAATDVQMSMRAAANAVQAADPAIIGYERVADGGACAFCQEVDTAFVYSADSMALHNNCGCGLEPVTSQSRGARTGVHGQHAKRTSQYQPNVAIHQHGELGAVLGDPAHSFTGPGGL